MQQLDLQMIEYLNNQLGLGWSAGLRGGEIERLKEMAYNEIRKLSHKSNKL